MVTCYRATWVYRTQLPVLYLEQLSVVRRAMINGYNNMSLMCMCYLITTTCTRTRRTQRCLVVWFRVAAMVVLVQCSLTIWEHSQASPVLRAWNALQRPKRTNGLRPRLAQKQRWYFSKDAAGRTRCRRNAPMPDCEAARVVLDVVVGLC